MARLMAVISAIVRFFVLMFLAILALVALTAFLPADATRGLVSVIPLLGIAAAAVGTWWHFRSSTMSSKAADHMVSEARAWIEGVQASGKSPAPDTGSVIIPKGQTALLSEPSSLFEFRSDGGRSYLGTRVKVGSFPLYLGRSQRTARKFLEQTASGRLTLTGGGLLFVSPGKTVAYDLDKIVGVEATADSIIVNVSNRVNPLLASVTNPVKWALAIRLLASGELVIKA